MSECVCWPGGEELIEIIDKQMTFLQVCCTCLIIATHVCATRVRATRSGHFDVACLPTRLPVFATCHFYSPTFFRYVWENYCSTNFWLYAFHAGVDM